MMSKRGSLSISTNAIVVLIIAVIMLGLIIGLVTRGFSAVEDRFFAQLEDSETPAATPSNSQPVTMSRSLLAGSPGDTIGLKIKIRNTESVSGNAPYLQPSIECLGEANVIQADSALVYPKQIAQSEFAEFTYVATLSGTLEEKRYLCKMGAEEVVSETDATPANPDRGADIPATEFFLEVR